MGRTIEISEDVYHRLQQQAQAQGISVAQLIAQLEEQVQRLRLSAAIESLQAKGVLLSGTSSVLKAVVDFSPLPVEGNLLSEAIIRERR
jgi:predicted CopG family antitoxin